MKNTYNLTGNAGEYFVCSELSKLNILALLTPKNNPLFDIIATNSDGSKQVAIQVKTMGLNNEHPRLSHNPIITTFLFIFSLKTTFL